MSLELVTVAIAVTTAVACALSGSYLVLRREALVGEGLSHAVLPGIVIAFLLTGDRTSPLLVIGAAVSGLAMLLLVQAIERGGVTPPDASLGIVFSALFAAGVVMANEGLTRTYFHPHMIIEGNLALAPLDRLVVGGVDLGPRSLWTLGVLLALLVGFIQLFKKELELMVFDPNLAEGLGFAPRRVHLAWLFLVALTTVAAFEIAGTILVVALMITPAAAATLWVDGIARTVLLSALLGALGAVVGCGVAFGLDLPPAAVIASVLGIQFVVSLVAAPRHGWRASVRRAARQRLTAEGNLLRERLGLEPGDRLDSVSVDGAAARAELGWSKRRFARVLARERSAD